MEKYEDFINKFKNSELNIYKKNCSFIEKLLVYLGYDFLHTTFKKVIDKKKQPENNTEEKIRIFYDAYNYLLNNQKTKFSVSVIKRFYYLLTLKEINEQLALKVQNIYYNFKTFFSIEKACDMHFKIYEMLEDEEEIKFTFSLMMLNYFLLSFNIPTIKLLYNDFINYNEAKQEYFKGNKTQFYKLILDNISKQKVQPKDYYKNLEPVSRTDVINLIRNDQEIIKNMYQIETILLYGSFAKGLQRIDSDLDLLIVSSEDITFEDKLKNVEELKKYLYYKFKRFVDIQEISRSISEECILAYKDYIKII